MNLSENANLVLKARYLRKNIEGRVNETPDELFNKVATSVAEAESFFSSKEKEEYWEEKFYKGLTSFEFLPNSPTLMNAGTTVGQLSAWKQN